MPQRPAGELPTWEQIYERMNAVAMDRGEWAGYPRLVPGHAVVIEPTHILARDRGETRIYLDDPEAEPERDRGGLPAGWSKVNEWWSERRGVTVNVYRTAAGRAKVFFLPDQSWPIRLYHHLLPAIGLANHAEWEPEHKAMGLLRGIVTPVQFGQYVLTGSFIEQSRRSGAAYVFRKGAPTIALGFGSGRSTFLTALCLHPLGYYEGTRVGCMTPTDDVIAHLLLMRTDEPLFWRKANHHPAHSAAAAI